MATSQQPSARRPLVAARRRQDRTDAPPRETGGLAPAPRADVVVRRTCAALALVFGPPASRAFTVRLWDGTTELPPAGTPSHFTLVLNSPASLRQMLLPPSELRLGSSYVHGAFDVEGDMEAAHAVAHELRERLGSVMTAARALAALARLPRPRSPGGAAQARGTRKRARWTRHHSPSRDAESIRAHYDVGNDFYALWLDRRLVYSCAYFETGTEDLDRAQEAKLEHLCRKLRLRPGERLLDVGCGWGGLVVYAASHYGVEARGITLSGAQAAVARDRIAAAGLAHRCRVDVCDYRAVSTDRPYDKVVSVGMIEHVGRAQLARYARDLFRLTAPGGLFLNHGIVTPPPPRGVRATVLRRVWRDGQFIDRYIFPDGELPRLSAIVHTAEAAGFETRDVESLREHYARTLREWVRRLEAGASHAARLVGAETVRAWRLYMAASAHAFACGHIGLAQVLFAKPTGGVVGLPPTRADLYAAPATPATAASVSPQRPG